MDFLNCADKRLLSLLEAAFERLHSAQGPGFRRGEEATRRFRACCAGLADADDAAPVSARECDALLPLVEEDEDEFLPGFRGGNALLCCLAFSGPCVACSSLSRALVVF